MCGNDLRIRPTRRQRVSWIDTLLVLAVVGLLGFWWRLLASDPATPESTEQADAFSAADIPELIPTDTPTPTPTPTLTPTPTPLPPVEVLETYIVRPGDTLISIATQYGVAVSRIQQINSSVGAIIRPGDPIKVPVLRVPTPVPNLESEEPAVSYTVNAGDTVVSIAAQFGSTIEKILSINRLDGNALIRPGDTLRVPVRKIPEEVLSGTSVIESVTDGQGKVYAAPQLVGPTNGVVLSRSEPILLRWTSVDILAENEYYVLRILPDAGETQTLPLIWTKSNSYRLMVEFAPPEGKSAQYSWRVSVVRINLNSGGQRILEAASPNSTVHFLTWQ